MHGALVTDAEVRRQTKERKEQDEKKMCATRSGKKRRVPVHETSVHEENDPDEPEE